MISDIDLKLIEVASKICDYIKCNVHRYYDCYVTRYSLSFGISNEKLILLSSSNFNISANAVLTEYLKDDEPKFNSFIAEELARTVTDGCYTQQDDCRKALYRIEKYLVVSFRARLLFPSIDEARLHYLVKNRFRNENGIVSRSTVNVCIRCFHVYSTEKTICHLKKIENRLPSFPEPAVFESLVPREYFGRKNLTVGFTADRYKPRKFGINLQETALLKGGPRLGTVPTGCKVTPIQPLVQSKEKWVQRLADDVKYKGFGTIPQEMKIPHESPIILPEIQLNEHQTGIQCQQIYQKLPFNYNFIDQSHLKFARSLKKYQKAH